MEGQYLPCPGPQEKPRGEGASSLHVSEDHASGGLQGRCGWKQLCPWGQPPQDASGGHICSLQNLPPCLLLLPMEGGNAEQEAHDEPSKYKSISSPVTWVARVGHHQLLMLGRGVQQLLWGPGKRHNIVEGLVGAPQCCRSSWGGWQCPQLQDGDSQPCPCSQGQGHDAQFSSTSPACRCRCMAGCGQHLCCSGAQLPRSSLRSRENFRLDWVPSLLLSCGHRSRRRAMSPGVRGCSLSPCTPVGTTSPRKARPVSYHFSH